MATPHCPLLPHLMTTLATTPWMSIAWSLGEWRMSRSPLSSLLSLSLSLSLTLSSSVPKTIHHEMAEEAKEQLSIFEVETGIVVNRRSQKRKASPSKTEAAVTVTTPQSRKREKKK
jgi:hypothetical protein